MKEIEFHIPQQCDLTRAEHLIEQACAGLGLMIGMKGSLASCQGSVHWHYKKNQHKGTLELTLYPKERRIWAQVQNGRRAPWIDIELPPLQRAIEGELRREARHKPMKQRATVREK